MAIHTLIIGQGLAGTALAWQLRRRRHPFLVVDDAGPNPASRVAAGLVTPVTGRALRARPEFSADRAEAQDLYKCAEETTGRRFWREQPALRLLDGIEAVDRARAAHRRDPALLELGGVLPAGFRRVAGLANMPLAARLDVSAYLDASADQFSSEKTMRRARIAAGEIRISNGKIRIDPLDLNVRNVVWCGGARDHDNAWLPEASLSPARGEMIHVRLTGGGPSQVVHRGGRWLRPLGDGTHQFGATYDHTSPTAKTTADARDRLLADLADWLIDPPALLGHSAGVRPVARDRTAFIRTHAVHRCVHMFNGLGSHGVLVAPRLAASLAERLCD